MRHRTKTKLYGKWLKLVTRVDPRTGRKAYVVIAEHWRYANLTSSMISDGVVQQIHEHFKPNRPFNFSSDNSWKYRTKKEAEQLITMALVKWGG